MKITETRTTNKTMKQTRNTKQHKSKDWKTHKQIQTNNKNYTKTKKLITTYKCK